MGFICDSQNMVIVSLNRPISVDARSKPWVCGRSLAGGLWVWIPPGAWMYVSCERCVLSGRSLCDMARSLYQRSSTECGVSECDREAWIMRRPWPTGGWRAIKEILKQH